MHPDHRGQADADRLPEAVGEVPASRKRPVPQLQLFPPTVHSDLPAVDESLNDENAGRLPSWRSAAGLYVRQEEHSTPRPLWLREPCTFKPAVEADTTDLMQRLNTVFADAYDNEIVPGLAEVVGACGYSSIIQMINDARRKGAKRMRVITRALLAITAYYEHEALNGNRVALSILERIPQFDDLEAMEQVATRPFAPQPQEHVVHLSGMERRQDRGKDLSPWTLRTRSSRCGTFEEIAAGY
jgi:hypothetical protein